MAKPILTIDNFDQGITYDETESTTSGFNDLSNIDIKSTLGVAQLSRDFTLSTGSSYCPTNKMIPYSLIPDVSLGDKDRQFFFVGSNGDNRLRLKYWNPVTKTESTLYNPSNNPGAVFSELGLFNNTFYFSGQPNLISSCAVWSSGGRENITTDGTTVYLQAKFSGYPFMKTDKSIKGGTLWYYDTAHSLGWLSKTITDVTSITDSAITLTVNSAITYNDTYLGYITNGFYGSVLRADGTSLSLTLPNASVHYRPMITFINNLYIGDGDKICQLDNLKATFNISGSNGSISVGYNNTIKQFEQIGGYMYILADSYNSGVDSSYFKIPKVNSKLYIWDGISNEFSNIIDIGAHCYCIKVVENRVYALIDSGIQNGVLFTYFNGSDFPTIAKLQVTNPSCPINAIAYDRGRFYLGVNSLDAYGSSNGYSIFSYSSYAIEAPSVSKIYTSASGRIAGIDFVKDTINSYMMLFKDNSSSCIYYNDGSIYVSQGTIQTQKYEITPNQFGQLVRGIQINCKETLPAGTSIDLKYRGDEETSFTSLVNITSANQNTLIRGINRRYKRIQFQVIMNSTGASTPKIVKIMLY